MAAPVNIINRNPVFSPYAIDDPPELPPTKGIANPAYENCTTDQDPSHHYDDPSHFNTSTGRRQKHSPIYESAETHLKSTKYPEEPVEPYRESRLNFVILFVILLVSIIALVLVIMIIMGKLGPGCSCSNTASPSAAKLEGSSGTSLVDVYNEINALKQNISATNQKNSKLQDELNDAKKEIQLLQGKFAGINNIDELWQQANRTKDKVEEQKKKHNTLSNSLHLVNESLTTKLTSTARELMAVDSTMSSSLNTINNTLTSKIDAVSKMQGPMGPRGNNGSQGLTGQIGPQGPIGPRGYNGTQGIPGVQGERGLQGIPGVNGSEGPRGLKGISGTPGVNGTQGSQGIQGRPGAGNLTQCVVDILRSTGIGAAKSAQATVIKEEKPGKKIVHASCSSNIADTMQQEKLTNGAGNTLFKCICSGKSDYGGFSDITMYCYITYTECPLIS